MNIKSNEIIDESNSECQILKFFEQSMLMIGEGMTKQHDERPEVKRISH